jgi:hypothetical protein
VETTSLPTVLCEVLRLLLSGRSHSSTQSAVRTNGRKQSRTVPVSPRQCGARSGPAVERFLLHFVQLLVNQHSANHEQQNA